MRQNLKLVIRILSFAVLFSASETFAEFPEPVVRFHTLKETVARLLPDSENLTRRDIALTAKHLARLKTFKNWDTDTTEFVLYHSRNKNEKIVRTLILFPEHTRQGTLLVAVALNNRGTVMEAVLMEAQRSTIDWILPLLRADYMKIFAGKDSALRLVLDKKFKDSSFSNISQTYALRLANTVKKSAQLFQVFFNKK
ncbi:MAG: hypothetical protein V3U37_00300 [Nitrospinaceae bacterium]